MWTFIVIIIAAIIIWAIVSNNTDNEKIREHNNRQGGLKSQFLSFSNILENKFNMNLKYDDGRMIRYKKEVSIGELNIGVHLDYANFKIIYSEIIKKDGTIIKGQNVTYPIVDDVKLMEDSINFSIKNLMSEISKLDLKNQQIYIPAKKHTKHWFKIINNTNTEDEINFYAKKLFLNDDINPDVVRANLFYYKFGEAHPERYESPSIRHIASVPLIFSDLFISAYPDVYLWIKKKELDISRFDTLHEQNNNRQDLSSLMDFYRLFIDQYLVEKTKLECQNPGFRFAPN
ncbi:hypothetical protein ASG01_13435 [Chryseobacterium sp. Leaf180]|uniref:hypothetical protein n=1 Tax=Chryseobacterium sp. Leaf180 TaxID=1736289 RepID=UPI00070232B0|nr:hypothetical protein [Chryseobacterium sp. Leaf180]KQR91995.1 hypothetical protein ASG01_13435 [Chryseobacterium sp. Leaf180]